MKMSALYIISVHKRQLKELIILYYAVLRTLIERLYSMNASKDFNSHLLG